MSSIYCTVQRIVLRVGVEMVDIRSTGVAGDQHLDDVVVSVDGGNLHGGPPVLGHVVPRHLLNMSLKMIAMLGDVVHLVGVHDESGHLQTPMLTGEVDQVLETDAIEPVLQQMLEHLGLVAGNNLLDEPVHISHSKLWVGLDIKVKVWNR